MGLPNLKIDVGKINGGVNFFVKFAYFHDDVKNHIKSISGSEYKEEVGSHENIWVLPATSNTIKKIELLNTHLKKSKKAEEIWERLKQNMDDPIITHNLDDVDISDYDFNYEPWEHQEEAFRLSRKIDNVGLLFEMGPQPLDANVLTPEGFKKMVDIEPGDSVIGRDGYPTTVNKTMSHDKKDVYKIEFSDRTTTQCTKDHLWDITTPTRKHRAKHNNKNMWETNTLHDIMKDGLRDSNGWNKYFVPINDPIQFKDNDINIDPYLLGALIGDGGLTSEVKITTEDSRILNEVEKRSHQSITASQYTDNTYGLTSHEPNNVLIDKLRRIGLLGKKSKGKFIPENYLHASIKDREELLQGLIDTDGTISQSSKISYSSSSEQLIDDVAYLVRNLGGTATKHRKRTSDEYDDSYRLYIKLPQSIKPCKLDRKLKNYRPEDCNVTKSIRNIEYIGKKSTKCIKVDNADGLYITDSFTVTHNSGKTKATIDIICDKFQRDKISSAIILAPLAVQQVWYSELEEHATNPYDLIDLHCNNNKRRRKRHLQKCSDYKAVDDILTLGITTYDTAWRIADDLIDCEFDAAIADESTDIKSHDAKRTKGAIKLAKSDSVDYRYILTGTAITNSPLDAWSQFEFLNPEIFNQNYYQFQHTYAIMGGYGGKEVVSYQNLDDLKQKIHSVSVRVTKDECLDLPDKVFEERYVPLDSQEQEYYDELKKESILRLNEKDEVTVTNILAEMAKLQQIANGFLNIKEIEEIGEEPETKVEVFGNSKLNELQNIIENLNGSKLVVWCKFRQDIKMIEEMVDEQFETDSVALHGGTSDQSGELQERFHNDPECQVFISQLQAGAKGIDLTAASHCVYYSNSFSLDNYLQSQDRLHREGQDNKVTYIHLISEGTIDEKIHASLEENEEMAKEIMDEYRKDGISDDIFE